MIGIKKFATRMFFIASLTVLLVCSASAQATRNTDVSNRIELLIKGAGRTYVATGTGTWVIDTPKGKMLVAAADTFVVAGFIIAPKTAVPKTETGLLKLLSLNHSIDFAKVGTDDDGDLFLRSELPFKLLDQAAFNEMLTNLINNFDMVKNAITP